MSWLTKNSYWPHDTRIVSSVRSARRSISRKPAEALPCGHSRAVTSMQRAVMSQTKLNERRMMQMRGMCMYSTTRMRVGKADYCEHIQSNISNEMTIPDSSPNQLDGQTVSRGDRRAAAKVDRDTASLRSRSGIRVVSYCDVASSTCALAWSNSGAYM